MKRIVAGLLAPLAALAIAGMVAPNGAAHASTAASSVLAAPAGDCSLHVYYYIRNGRPGDMTGSSVTTTLVAAGHGDGYCTKPNPTINGNVYLVDASDSGKVLTWDSLGHELYDATEGRYPAAQSWGAIPIGTGFKQEFENYYANQLHFDPCVTGPGVGSSLAMGPCLPNGSASELWQLYPQ